MAAAEERRSEASMSTLIETHDHFSSRVYQILKNRLLRSRASVDIIPIRFHWYKAYANYNPEIQDYKEERPILLREKTLKLRFSREKASGDEKTTMERFARYQRVIAGSPREANRLRNKLSRYLHTAVGVVGLAEEEKHPVIIEQIMDMLQAAVPDEVIEVPILHLIFRDTKESLHLHPEDLCYRAKLIPATESFIQGLEEMKSPPLDDEELECPVCKEMFAQEKDSSSITQLACSHYFHRDCIVPWLQINHLCPTCRHPS